MTSEDWESLQEFINAGMKKSFSETVVDHSMNPRTELAKGKTVSQVLTKSFDVTS